MEAPSAVGFTYKERLKMFWEHKKPFLLCVLSIILVAIAVLVIFIVA
jgi:hypothetical protein